jgi:hypothetical protein
LIIGWAIIGWYACTVRDTAVHLNYKDWQHFYDPKVWQPVIVPGQAVDMTLPSWLGICIAVAAVCGVLACAWAAIDVAREAQANPGKLENLTTIVSDLVVALRSLTQRQQQADASRAAFRRLGGVISTTGKVIAWLIIGVGGFVLTFYVSSRGVSLRIPGPASGALMPPIRTALLILVAVVAVFAIAVTIVRFLPPALGIARPVVLRISTPVSKLGYRLSQLVPDRERSARWASARESTVALSIGDQASDSPLHPKSQAPAKDATSNTAPTLGGGQVATSRRQPVAMRIVGLVSLLATAILVLVFLMYSLAVRAGEIYAISLDHTWAGPGLGGTYCPPTKIHPFLSAPRSVEQDASAVVTLAVDVDPVAADESRPADPCLLKIDLLTPKFELLPTVTSLTVPVSRGGYYVGRWLLTPMDVGRYALAFTVNTCFGVIGVTVSPLLTIA